MAITDMIQRHCKTLTIYSINHHIGSHIPPILWRHDKIEESLFLNICKYLAILWPNVKTIEYWMGLSLLLECCFCIICGEFWYLSAGIILINITVIVDFRHLVFLTNLLSLNWPTYIMHHMWENINYRPDFVSISTRHTFQYWRGLTSSLLCKEFS